MGLFGYYRYICVQVMVEKKETVAGNTNIEIGYIVRRVRAKSRDEAIGRFLTRTAYVKALQKFKISCSLEKEISLLK